ncbi:MAG: DUF58 domain-containing protein [Thermomicrobiales bacterium]|nr:DUF58 domain-containing protein [Thermomicrobiales bacterium]
MRFTLPFQVQRGPSAAAVERPTLQDPDGPLFDEAMLAAFRRLVILSRQTIAEGLAGEHRSKRRGSSPEFADFKIYSQGDDFRRIDWNLYARLDEVFVRLSEITTELTIHVLVDASNSMHWRGGPGLPTKFRYGRQLAGALSYVSLWHFDRVVIVPFGAELGQAFGPAQGRAHTVPMLRFLSELVPMGETDLPGALEQYVRARRRPGLLLLVSDLLSGEPEQLAERLRDLRSRGWQTIVAHIVDEGELSAGGVISGETDGPARPSELIDLETGDRIRVTPSDEVVARYEAAVNEWLAQVEEACIAEKADYLQLHTAWPFQSVILQLLHRRGLVA